MRELGGGGSVYGDDGGVLGYAIAMAGHDARDVRAMAVAIKVALVAKVGAPLGSASELDVARQDAPVCVQNTDGQGRHSVFIPFIKFQTAGLTRTCR